MKLVILMYLIVLISPLQIYGQYQFKGKIDTSVWKGDTYLSLVEDYRKISGIYAEQILQKTTADSIGYFSFSGDNLPVQNRIYRIHVDNCGETQQHRAHLNGDCTNSKYVLFIARNMDTISFPFTFENEMFCKINATNEKSNAFIEVDSMINEMRFAFGNYPSITNRKINSVKWLGQLQEFVLQKNEPLIELYVYGFISNKTNELYPYYLEDLETNPYYNQLLARLKDNYPNSTYTHQYEKEITSDRFLINSNPTPLRSTWIWILLGILSISMGLNFLQFFKSRKEKKTSESFLPHKLTQQEQKILTLILEDKTNKEIASLIFVSVSTVKTHINNLYKKLKVSSRDEVKSLYNR